MCSALATGPPSGPASGTGPLGGEYEAGRFWQVANLSRPSARTSRSGSSRSAGAVAAGGGEGTAIGSGAQAARTMAVAIAGRTRFTLDGYHGFIAPVPIPKTGHSLAVAVGVARAPSHGAIPAGQAVVAAGDVLASDGAHAVDAASVARRGRAQRRTLARASPSVLRGAASGTAEVARLAAMPAPARERALSAVLRSAVGKAASRRTVLRRARHVVVGDASLRRLVAGIAGLARNAGRPLGSTLGRAIGRDARPIGPTAPFAGGGAGGVRFHARISHRSVDRTVDPRIRRGRAVRALEDDGLTAASGHDEECPRDEKVRSGHMGESRDATRSAHGTRGPHARPMRIPRVGPEMSVTCRASACAP